MNQSPGTDRHQPVATIERLCFSYGDRRAVDDVSLQFFPGEIFVLMGPNGAGKSSLVRLLAGSLKPSAGRVSLARAADGTTPVGLVPQDVALYSWLSPRENCRAFGRVAGLDRRTARTRADEVLHQAKCEEIADVPVAQLSGGNKRRANIAAALMTDPRFLVLDEPTVGVDLAARHAIAGMIRALRDQALAVLIVTHDFAEADGLADRVGFLRDGRLVAHGRPADMITGLFGSRKRIELLLAAPPVDGQMRALAACGAAATADPTVWISYRDLDGWDPGRFAAALAATGLAVGELRLRDPGLESLYTRFCDADRAH